MAWHSRSSGRALAGSSSSAAWRGRCWVSLFASAITQTPSWFWKEFKRHCAPVVWFVAFALFDRLPWCDRIRCRAIAVGSTALLLNLCVSDGISSPQLAVLFWACAGLALNSAPLKPTWSAGSLPALALPLAGCVAVVMTYFFLAVNPVVSASNLQQEAEKARPTALGEFWGRKVVGPLSEAAEKADPGDSRRWLDLARAIAEQYRRQPLLSMLPTKLKAADKARELDPANAAGYLIPYYHLMSHAEQARAAKKLDQSKENYREAGEMLEEFLPYDPTDPPLYYLLALAYHSAENEKWAPFAREALRLDSIQRQQPLQSPRILETAQRNTLQEWLKAEKR